MQHSLDTTTDFPIGRSATVSSNSTDWNSRARPRGTRPSALRAPVAVSTNRSAARFNKPTLSTLTRPESNATANKRGSGRSPPKTTRCTRSGRVEEAMFPKKSSARTSRERSSVMAGRRIRPSVATSSGVGHTFSGRLRTPPRSRRRRTDLSCPQTAVRRSPDSAGERLDNP